MLKFFRKYNMIILVVGGCFLMVAFLVGSSLQQLQGMMQNQTIATMRGVKISGNDYARAQTDFAIVKQMMDPVFPQFVNALEGTDGSGIDTWLMLSTEAQRLGLVGGVQDGQNMVSLAADMAVDTYFQYQYRMPVTPQLLEIPEVKTEYDAVHSAYSQIMDQARQQILKRGNSERAVDMALARAHGVLRVFQANRNEASLVSAPELRAHAQEVLDVAVVGMVTLNALAAADELPEPTEDEIQTQYETYRTVRPGEGLLGFGYLRPPAVQVEWINIDQKVVANELPLDRVAVRVFHKNNKTQRGWSDDFETVKDQVEQAMRTERASEIVASGVDAARNEMRRLSSPLSDDGRFKKVPDDWRAKFASMDEIAGRIRETMTREAGVDVSAAVTVLTTANEEDPWKSARQAMLLPGIGRSVNPGVGAAGRGWTTFGEYALQLRGLVPDDAATVQEGLVYGPLTGGEDRYFFRVIDHREESPPESLEEVRTAVVKDARLLQGWNHLKAVVADEAKALAQAEGLDAVGRKYGMTAQRPFEVSRLGMTPKMEKPQPIRGENQPELRDAIMDLVEPWDPLVDVASLPLDQRVVVMPIEQAKGLVVVVVEGRYPATRERFFEAYTSVERAALSEFAASLNDNIYSTERLRERFDFKEVKKRGSRNDDAIDEEAAEDSTD
ncbi:MAG: hypothetical protein KDA16_08255 [Phycisphaerales bacterium]|nr:hypothetical protein [Phycisphaerales bacterium]